MMFPYLTKPGPDFLERDPSSRRLNARISISSPVGPCDRDGLATPKKAFGEVAEWSNAAVSKTVIPSGIGSSNLPLSAFFLLAYFFLGV